MTIERESYPDLGQQFAIEGLHSDTKEWTPIGYLNTRSLAERIAEAASGRREFKIVRVRSRRPVVSA